MPDGADGPRITRPRPAADPSTGAGAGGAGGRRVEPVARLDAVGAAPRSTDADRDDAPRSAAVGFADLDGVGDAPRSAVAGLADLDDGGDAPHSAVADLDHADRPPDADPRRAVASFDDLDQVQDSDPPRPTVVRFDGRAPAERPRRDRSEPSGQPGGRRRGAPEPVREGSGIPPDDAPRPRITVDPAEVADDEPARGGRSGARRGGRRGSPGGGGARGRRPGEPLPPDVDPVAVARDICLRLLTDRARTRQELAQALSRRGVPDEAAATVLERFDEVGLIDDAAFAGQWVRSRHRHRGLGRRAIAVELRRKGVDGDVAEEALAEVDAEAEERRARELVDRKLRTTAAGTAEERVVAARRLVGMLARKGYGAGTAYRVVREALAAHGADIDELGVAEDVDD